MCAGAGKTAVWRTSYCTGKAPAWLACRGIDTGNPERLALLARAHCKVLGLQGNPLNEQLRAIRTGADQHLELGRLKHGCEIASEEAQLMRGQRDADCLHLSRAQRHLSHASQFEQRPSNARYLVVREQENGLLGGVRS